MASQLLNIDDVEREAECRRSVFLGRQNLQRHLPYIIKWVCLTSGILTCVCTLCIVCTFTSRQVCPMDYEIKEQYRSTTVESQNLTACVYFEEYILEPDMYTVCINTDGDVGISTHRIVNDSVIVPGIHLNLEQWFTLKQLTAKIDIAISTAREHWVAYQRRQQNTGNYTV
jgi:hypothetical protein